MTTEKITFGPEHDTFGKRLKHARELRRFSRKQLAERSSVGEKTIERYEYGTTEGKPSQVENLSEALDVPAAVLLFGAAEEAGYEDETTAPTPAPSKRSTQPTEAEILQQRAEHLMAEVDTLRRRGFGNAPRFSAALIDDLRDAFRYMEAEEIHELARQEGLEGFDETENEDDPSGVPEIIERLIDNVMLGTDLYGFPQGKLEAIAEKYEVESKWLGWDGIGQIIEAIRPKLRESSLKKAGWDRLEVLE